MPPRLGQAAGCGGGACTRNRLCADLHFVRLPALRIACPCLDQNSGFHAPFARFGPSPYALRLAAPWRGGYWICPQCCGIWLRTAFPSRGSNGLTALVPICPCGVCLCRALSIAKAPINRGRCLHFLEPTSRQFLPLVWGVTNGHLARYCTRLAPTAHTCSPSAILFSRQPRDNLSFRHRIQAQTTRLLCALNG